MRVALWLMVLSLWGLMIYQFVEEDVPEVSKMKWITKQLKPADDIPDFESQPTILPEDLFPEKPPEDLTSQPAATVKNVKTGAKLARIPNSISSRPPTKYLRDRSPASPLPFKSREKPVVEKTETPPEARPPKQEDAPATPKGFVKRTTPHFYIYAESKAASEEFLETLEHLHGNIMLDLASFSPWARDERVSIFLFRTQESYRRVTGRPAWSGGASSVKRRKIYLYESEEVVGILAHELCHIYFDSFFINGRGSPLWLSEGMATLVQSERGLAAPNWLKPNLKTLQKGGGYGIEELIKVEETTGAADEEVRLWYTQSYSVVRFLIRSQYRSSFYKFCRFLRDGSPVSEALYRSYGMPFNRTKALEFAWRYDIQSNKPQ